MSAKKYRRRYGGHSAVERRCEQAAFTGIGAKECHNPIEAGYHPGSPYNSAEDFRRRHACSVHSRCIFLNGM
ncbi:MAG: hypothetical protein IJ087_10435, partial [Eggerthellaceae bacterium]|nr:hypothetical protein [Eggerthellaceae bacterium]